MTTAFANIKDILLRRQHVIVFGNEGRSMTKDETLAFVGELAAMGYRVKNPENLANISMSEVAMNFGSYIEPLRALRGGDVDYVPLFQGFPENIPDDTDHLYRRILGFFGYPRDYLFNMEDFGADPVTGFQTQELFDKGVIRQKGRRSDTKVVWVDIEVLTSAQAFERALNWMRNCLYAKSPIKETIQPEVISLLNFFANDVDASKIALRENKAMYARYLWDGKRELIPGVLKDPTDILRLFAAVTESDISLAEKIKFPRLGRLDRKMVLQILESSGKSVQHIAENMLPYKGLWLALGRYIHPGEFSKQYPMAASAFHALRNGKVRSFNGQVETAIEDGDTATTLRLLRQRPGVMARKLHELLRKLDTNEVIRAFESIAESVPLKTLLLLQSYFRTINTADNRCIVNKKGKMKVIANQAVGMLSHRVSSRISVSIATAITNKLGKEEGLGKVWVDPALDGYVVPFQQRKASDGLIPLARGSQADMDDSPVLRMFIYWKCGQTDLDLSCVSYDADMNYLGHVSYTNLSASGIKHSGDILRAPNGAAEFIDIRLDSLKPNVAFLAIQVNKYSGRNFGDLDQCYAGFMMRDKCSSQQSTFDIKTVGATWNVAGNGRQSLPIVADLRRKKVVYVDLYKSAEVYTNVENTLDSVTTLIKEVMKFTDTRPNLYDLAMSHASARGTLVEDKEDADVTFGLTDCDYNASDLEKILDELLV
jgi:stress response protein SCP2